MIDLYVLDVDIMTEIEELKKAIEEIREKIKRLVQPRKGWLIFYTKDICSEEDIPKVKEICERASKAFWCVLPSEYFNRVVYISDDDSQYKMWFLLEKMKKNVLFVRVGEK